MNINIEEVVSLYDQEQTIADTARKYCEKHGIEYTDSLRRKFSNILNKANVVSDTSTNQGQYRNKIESPIVERTIFTAVDPEGKMMNIETYCEHYGLDYSKVKSFKLISHSGTPFYNIVFFEESLEPVIDESEMKDIKDILEIKSNPFYTKIVNHKNDIILVSDFTSLTLRQILLNNSEEGRLKNEEFNIN